MSTAVFNFLGNFFVCLPPNDVVSNLEDFPDHTTLKCITGGTTESLQNSFKMVEYHSVTFFKKNCVAYICRW